MNITKHAEGMALYMQSMKSKGDEGDRLFNLAMSTFEAALSSTLDNKETIKSWGDALTEQSKRKKGKERTNMVLQASEKYAAIDSPRCLNELGLYLMNQAMVEAGAERWKLFELACQNFQAAVDAFNRSNKEAEIAKETVYINWGNTLFNWSKCKEGEEAVTLLEEAGDKYLKALQTAPECMPILAPWMRKNLKNRELAALVQLYFNNPADPFQTVDINCASIMTDALLAKIINEKPAIQTIRLSGSINGSAFSKALPSLTLLDLRECSNIGDETIANISKHCPSLVTLNLDYCFKLLNLPFSSKLEKLQVLGLADCKRLTEKAFLNIGDYCPSLLDLNLSNVSSVTDSGITYIVRNSTGIKNLNLNNCKQVGTAAVQAIAENLTGLRMLQLMGCATISDASVINLASKCTGLVNLKLGGCVKIGDDSVIAIAEHCPNLEQIDLRK